MIKALMQLPPTNLLFLASAVVLTLMFGAFWLLERRDKKLDFASELQAAYRAAREREERYWAELVNTHEKMRKQAEQRAEKLDGCVLDIRAQSARDRSLAFENHKTEMQELHNTYRCKLEELRAEHSRRIPELQKNAYIEGYIQALVPPLNDNNQPSARTPWAKEAWKQVQRMRIKRASLCFAETKKRSTKKNEEVKTPRKSKI